MTEPSLFEGRERVPLAARVRPRRIEDVLGQARLLGEGQPLGDMLRNRDLSSLVLWGPPGTGKTTIARLISEYTDSHFVSFSAVGGKVSDVRQIIEDATSRGKLEGRGTILFCDEIHRFNKAQQDAFLAAVEEGVITLVGATTENPSFELNSALLSRMRVFVLEPLDEAAMRAIVTRVLADGYQNDGFALDDGARAFLIRHAGGDARQLLNALEALHAQWGRGGRAGAVAAGTVETVLQRRFPRYDKSGEQHYDLVSALHKSVRGSDPDAALYWLARMIDGGEDVLYIARRLVRMAVEDIGLADPRALSVTLAAKDAYAFLGSPEGDLAVAEATVYLATAPKSNCVYTAFSSATEAAREHGAEPVPLHLRNAPTPLMRSLGYGDGYRYAHDYPDAEVDQEHLPEALRGTVWYRPSGRGYEARLARSRERSTGSDEGVEPPSS